MKFQIKLRKKMTLKGKSEAEIAEAIRQSEPKVYLGKGRENQKKKDENKDDITAESEGRYLLQEVSKRHANPVDPAQANVLMAEIVQGSRYDHVRLARYQAFAMMRR